jgi:hypothetical protein
VSTDAAASEMNPEAWIALGSAVIAIISLCFSAYVVRRQDRMQTGYVKALMDSDTLAWAQAAIDALNDAVAFVKTYTSLPAESRERTRIEHAQRLSALADRGRFYFPNLKGKTGGAAARQTPPAVSAAPSPQKPKEAAFEGLRPAALEALVFAHYQMRDFTVAADAPAQKAAECLRACTRLFVSEVQLGVDPRVRIAMQAGLVQLSRSTVDASYTAAAKIANEYEARYPGTLSMARDAAWIAEHVDAHARMAREAKGKF